MEEKPRWRRIFGLETLVREMDSLGEANRQASDPTSWTGGAERAAEASQPAAQPPAPPPLPGGYQPSNPIKEVATFVGPIVLVVWWFARDAISPLGYVLIGLFACLLGLPTIIAFSRGHPQKWAIMVLCMFGGWTGILWIAALVWSLTNPPPVQVIYVNAPPAPPPAPSSGSTTAA